MKAGLLFALLVPFSISTLTAAHAGDWRSKYSTGRKGETFEACCGVRDCRTAESLGYPQMKRLEDGSYDVKLGKYWLRYDFPAVSIGPRTQRHGSATWKPTSSRNRSAFFSRRA